MNNDKPHNTFMGDDGPPIKIPLPADAWMDMRKRLDDEMPEAGILLPDNIINAGTGFINGITALFTLLLIGSAAWWLTGTLNISNRNSLPKTVAVPQSNARTDKSNEAKYEGKAAHGPAQNTAGGIADKPAPANSLYPQAGKITTNGGLLLKSNPLSASANTQQTVMPQKNASPPVNIEQKKNEVQTPANDKILTAANAAAKQNRPDSSAEKDNEEVHVDDNSLHVMAGLQWQAQLPFGGIQHYFAGPNASSQPYRLLIPGAWVGFEIDRNLFVAEVSPFTSTVYNPKPFVTITTVDGQTEVTKTKKLNKLFGLSAAIRYSYNVKGKWWAGGGIHTDLVNKGVATVNTEINNNGTTTSSTSFARLETSDLSLLSKFKVRTDAEVFYRAEKWQAGLRAGVYFTPVTKTYSTQRNPLALELFYRWAIWNNNKDRH